LDISRNLATSDHFVAVCLFLCAAFANIVLLLSSTFNESGDVGYVSGDDWGPPLFHRFFSQDEVVDWALSGPKRHAQTEKRKAQKRRPFISNAYQIRWRWREIQKIIIISNFPKKSQRNGSQQKQKAWRKAHPHSTDLKRKPDARDFGG
jgi:hypothetical protein